MQRLGQLYKMIFNSCNDITVMINAPEQSVKLHHAMNEVNCTDDNWTWKLENENWHDLALPNRERSSMMKLKTVVEVYIMKNKHQTERLSELEMENWQ